jgi:hypothetical protein
MISFRDYPLEEIIKQADERINQLGGKAYVQQKWTCRHCGSRQTMETKNAFYRKGRCEECGELTTIDKCNYLLAIGTD